MLRPAELSDMQLLEQIAKLLSYERQTLAELLAHLAEVDRRKLYLEQACSSLFKYCTERLGFSEHAAYRRIAVARASRRFPVLLELVSEGRLHLAGLSVLVPHLTVDNHRELLADAAGMTQRQIEQLVAARFPKPDVPDSIRRLPNARRGAAGCAQPASQPVAGDPPANLTSRAAAKVQTPVVSGNPGADGPQKGDTSRAHTAPAAAPQPASHRPRVEPLSATRYRVQFTASQRLRDKLEQARELLSHVIPPGDLPALFERALDAVIAAEQKRRYSVSVAPRRRKDSRANALPNKIYASVQGPSSEADRAQQPAVAAHANGGMRRGAANRAASGRRAGRNGGTESAQAAAASRAASDTRAGTRSAAPADATRDASHSARQGAFQPTQRSRTIPAEVRRRVYERDGGQCTYIDAEGRRCRERHYLQFEHIVPFAHGGAATVENICLQCAMHNARGAEQRFGSRKIAREVAARRATGRRAVHRRSARPG